MPTENRSSNTEMVSVPREHELKIRQTPLADLLSGLKTGEVRDCSDREFAVGDTVLLREIDDARDYTGTVLRRTITHVQKHYGLPDHLCVLSYGQPAPQPHPEPIAWMVGTAFWWTKEEAERDAAETGLPIVGLGPMTDAAKVERLRAALKFYADRGHFAEDIGTDWDSVSGEPANILWHEHEAWFVEDGSIARAALSGKSEQDQRMRIADPSAISNQIGNEG
ncbi:DUF3850 domain-containing protein [Pseudomonas sp. HTZ1]|uniref:DUF3850 domain-containing protein n=1 Tax=Pseudomonas sp. HTZ1 TaxID=3075219 RepID=UPI00287F2D29|nr:DUF3850 domain-containing protein [Pseudomonas sp. HTZ1]MDS9590715.1 DUF3850 domain-containing protein [Pseudomonas sp. HTZ1]